ncbi:MAG TPA: DUF1800 domain-containing protein [Vicinamibacterales bacterium]|nr:DUF1800 domain-containing protein [Vicinamibacterales bacterium]
MNRFLVTAALVTAIGGAATAGPPPTDAAVTHLLNRIAFGPRPADVERVRAIGIDRYVDEQLHPERIRDDAMADRLANLATVRLSAQEIVETIERPQIEARRERKANGAEETATGAPPPREPMQQRSASLVEELAEQKILRAVYSERQLQEVLADFWFNHFNVDSRKGRDRFFVTAYERDAIRPHVLGRFRDLLGATAKSPAMLFYLDNWMSADPAGPHPEPRAPNDLRRRFGPRPFPGPSTVARAQPQPQNQARKGLNENYARELMELHTIGVDGGYTQKDVTEVARAFTGWTIENPRQGGGFVFNARLHDTGQKVVLGHVIKAGGGESDGEQVLDILAKHPSTARFIATKLVRRFVSDTPPRSLVDRAAKAFHGSNGDVREVMRTILASREFWSSEAQTAKVKSPFEFLVSALRAAGVESVEARPLVRDLQQMGMPLYTCQPPTGYKDTADTWMNTGALVNRINVALRLAGGDQALAERLGAPEFQKR